MRSGADSNRVSACVRDRISERKYEILCGAFKQNLHLYGIITLMCWIENIANWYLSTVNAIWCIRLHHHAVLSSHSCTLHSAQYTHLYFSHKHTYSPFRSIDILSWGVERERERERATRRLRSVPNVSKTNQCAQNESKWRKNGGGWVKQASVCT